MSKDQSHLNELYLKVAPSTFPGPVQTTSQSIGK